MLDTNFFDFPNGEFLYFMDIAPFFDYLKITITSYYVMFGFHIETVSSSQKFSLQNQFPKKPELRYLVQFGNDSSNAAYHSPF
ncbi:hypothetical protein A9Q81_03375 [Gammaproteobacteria bacterium 42_54_T18]|nr:hypothetical protein A9Q81_03375 [Gammaproteobacteria bacterium 42_54_T18]